MNMKDFENIQKLWQGGKEIDLPDANTIIKQIKKARGKMLRKNIIGVVALTLTFLWVGFVGWYYHFEHWTTKAGIIIVLVAIILGVFFNSWLIQLLLRNSDPASENRIFLQQMIRYRNVQQAIKNRGILLYYILLTTGLCLYMVEFAKRSLLFGIIAYTLSLGWIIFTWFYFHKKISKRQEQQLNEQIGRLEKVVHEIEGK